MQPPLVEVGLLFPTVEFAVFFLFVFVASWASARWPTLRKLILLAASYVFYGWWDPHFCLLLFVCTMVNYGFGLGLQGSRGEARRRTITTVAVVFNLAILGYFKYWGFFLSSAAQALDALHLGHDFKIFEALLPVGISFYTFQGISYIVDIYRGEIRAVKDPVDMLLFKSFFPQLIAGPIVRAKEFLPQLAQSFDLSELYATRAFLLIAMGLFKKVVIAHYLAVELVGPVFESPSSYGTIDLMFAAYGYAVQIYCDFSAYTDLAIGVALLFGYQFPANFNQPYRAVSLQDFWRRWHISLSRFLRDYLYIPLGGSRGPWWMTYRNLLLTMVLGGLWHGASWTFVFWGLLHGLGLCLEKVAAIPNLSFMRWPPMRLIRRFGTFHFVCLTWIFFNADSLSSATSFLESLGHTGVPPKIIAPFSLSLLLVGLGSQFLPANLLSRLEAGFSRVPLPMQGAFTALAVIAIVACGPGALAPFIYFRF